MKRKIEEKLLAWKNKQKDRKPIILNGAGQVGKTYILKEFGEKYFDTVVYVNLEINSQVRLYFEENLEPKKILRYLEAVAAAGCLLGVAINKNQYSFPVGKVETLELFPMDFKEFLWALDKNFLASEIRERFQDFVAMPEGLHKEALEYFRQYLIVGGMPAVVRSYLEKQSFLDVMPIQNEIVDNYIADMAKYASNTDSVKIRACYNSIPAQLAKENKKFQYKVVQKGRTAAIFGVSIEWLNLAGVVIKFPVKGYHIRPIKSILFVRSNDTNNLSCFE